MLLQDSVERIIVSRYESTKARMRKVGDKGTDVHITLAKGVSLRDGDVLLLRADKMLIVEKERENVALISLKDTHEENVMVELAFRIGHSLGNLHRPIIVRGLEVYLPIQADSELEMLNALFRPISDHIEIRRTSMVFEPQEGLAIHAHEVS
jgi:urease accessory protein